MDTAAKLGSASLALLACVAWLVPVQAHSGYGGYAGGPYLEGEDYATADSGCDPTADSEHTVPGGPAYPYGWAFLPESGCGIDYGSICFASSADVAFIVVRVGGTNDPMVYTVRVLVDGSLHGSATFTQSVSDGFVALDLDSPWYSIAAGTHSVRVEYTVDSGPWWANLEVEYAYIVHSGSDTCTSGGGGGGTYSGSREVVTPGVFYHPIVGDVHLAQCEDASFPGMATFCGTGGIGGATFDNIGCSKDSLPAAVPNLLRGNGIPDRASGCLDDIDGSFACVATDSGSDCDGKEDVANGSCKVRAGSTVSPGGASWFFLCGTDRDDDTLVTDADATGSSTTGGTPWDDDFVMAANNANPAFCFARDRISSGATDLNAAGDDWDDIVVFVGMNFGNLPAGSVGTLVVTLTATGGAGPCAWARSSHDGSGNSEYWVA